MDKKKGIIVLLIALVAVWFLFLRDTSTCVSECADETACEASAVHGCGGHTCAEGCAEYVAEGGDAEGGDAEGGDAEGGDAEGGDADTK